MKRFAIALVLLLTASTGWGTTYYVDATAGSDANDGLSEEEANGGQEPPYFVRNSISHSIWAAKAIELPMDIMAPVPGPYSTVGGIQFASCLATGIAM